MLAEKTPAGFVAFDLLALGDESLLDQPFEVRRARLEEALAGVGTGPMPPDPHDERPGRGRAVVQPVRGRRARRRGGQAARGAVPAERPHDAQDQARAHRRRRGRRLPAAQDLDAGDGRCSARCCSACTPTAGCSTSGSSASFTAGPARRADRGAAAAGVPTSPSTPGASGASGPSPTPTGSRARRAGGAPARTCRSRRCVPSGSRGRLRPHGGQPVPAHRAVQALAPGPRPGVLRLRAARGGR